MFYYLYEWWAGAESGLCDTLSVLRVLRYITVRAFCGAGTSFLLVVALGPAVIRQLRKLNLKEQVLRKDAPPLDALHGHKQGTPTMGGVLIVCAIVISSALWSIPGNRHMFFALATLCYMGAVGFWDDLLKIRKKDSKKGLSALRKICLQVLWAGVVTVCLVSMAETRDNALRLMVPFLKDAVIDRMPYIGAFIFIAAVIVGASNAVNLTDGLDGLAIGCGGSVAFSYLILSYTAGHLVFAEYLNIPYVPGGGELTVFCGCVLGACLGFLWYNCHPAQVFMGDTGSLALGGSIAMVAVLIKQELVLIVVGGVFVIEALSVIIQVLSFRLTGKRVFLMAPVHHHFELKNWSETQVTVRFWILSIICALLGILTLKIR